jgi:hypothetical protein
MIKRVICALVSHKWSRHRYPATPGDDQPEGTYLRCVRCGKVDESAGLPPGPMAGGF